MIVVKPFGGLCNRLRVIDSALTLARQLGTDAHVIWKTGPDMAAGFTDLFQPVPRLTFRRTGRFRFVMSPWDHAPIKSGLARILNPLLGVRHAFFERDMPRVWNGQIDVSTLKASRGDIYFCTCQSFTQWSTLDFSWVAPIPRIRQQVESLSRHFGDETIGVHIRRTDNEVALRESPLELFIACLEERKRQQPAEKFFLATDDPEAERALVARFGAEWITTCPKTFGRDSVEATQDAVVDLFCLARTREIVASCYSSFSETAAVMGRRPITFLKR